MRVRCSWSTCKPRFCWSASPRMLMNTTADRRSPPMSMSLTEMRPTSLTWNSRRMASPIARFNNSRTRSCRRLTILKSLNRHSVEPENHFYDVTIQRFNIFHSQLRRHFFNRITFNRVAHLKFAVAFDADAAFHAGANLVDFVLKTAQRLRDAFINDILATPHAHFAAHDAARADHAAGHRRALGQIKNLPDFGGTNDGVLEVGIEQAGHGIFHLINQFVDDRVKFDLHARALGFFRDHLRID